MKKVTIVLWLVLVLAASAAFGQQDPLAEFGKMRIETARADARAMKEWVEKLQTFRGKLETSGRDLVKGLSQGDSEILQSLNRMIGSQRGVVQTIKEGLKISLTSLRIETASGCKEGSPFPFETQDCDRFKKAIQETEIALKLPEPQVLVDAWEKAKKAYPDIFKE